jgi:hypothetical protein
MMAYLGLAYEPAEVMTIAADRVTLKSSRAYAPGLRMVVEFVNPAHTFTPTASLRVGPGQWVEDGFTFEGVLSPPLLDDELWFLVGER